MFRVNDWIRSWIFLFCSVFSYLNLEELFFKQLKLAHNKEVV